QRADGYADAHRHSRIARGGNAAGRTAEPDPAGDRATESQHRQNGAARREDPRPPGNRRQSLTLVLFVFHIVGCWGQQINANVLRVWRDVWIATEPGRPTTIARYVP